MNTQHIKERTTAFLVALVVTAAASAPAVVAASQDGLTSAKDLYAAASYEEALKALDAIPATTVRTVASDIALYRILCLLALQRTDDATKIIQEMVAENPYYHLSDAQASPRVQSVYEEVRRAALPGLVQRRYAEAKASFEKNDPHATELFERLLTLLDDPDLKGVTSADFRVLVVGFRDLSRALAAPVPAAQPAVNARSAAPEQRPPASGPSAPAANAPAPAPAPPAPAASSQPVVVKPPVTLSQPMPKWAPTPSDATKVFTGRLEIVIDERGTVTSAVLDAPVYPNFDEELLQMARTWRFRPATRNGVPISYVKVIPIQLQRNR